MSQLLEMLTRLNKDPNVLEASSRESLLEMSDDDTKNLIYKIDAVVSETLLPGGMPDPEAMQSVAQEGIQVSEAGVPGEVDQQGLSLKYGDVDFFYRVAFDPTR
jgi:hypothetical protein